MSDIDDGDFDDDLFEGDDDFDIVGDVEEEDDDLFDYEGERIANDFEEEQPATMSCCGAPRLSWLGDDEPCPNCGAI